MRKLSDTQVRAIEYVATYSNELDPSVRPNTWASLHKAGLIVSRVNGLTRLTELGRDSLLATTGQKAEDLEVAERPERPVISTIEQAHDLFPAVADKVNEVGKAIGDLAPVFTEAAGSMEKLAEALPETREDGLLTDAAVSRLLKDAGILDDPSRYDEPRVVANRADRRAEQKARASRNRAAMRLRHQPSRRQVRATTLSEGLKLGDALRTADGPGMVIGISQPADEYDRTGRPVIAARVQLADRSERTVDFSYGEKLRLLV